jgi:hypothetical protein
MGDLRLWLERALRAAGTFRVTKRALQRAQTAGWSASTACKRLVHRDAWPTRRRGNAVMFHTGRSGSSVVADLLGRHPDIHWDGELFNYDVTFWRKRPRQRLMEARKRIGRRITYANVPFYGFEVLPTHLRAGQIKTREFIATLEDFGVGHFILLERRNVLRKIVSSLVARERGRWRLKSGETAPLTRVHIDTENLRLASVKPLVDHIREFENDCESLRAILRDRRTLHLVYEEDVAEDPRRAYRSICDFLGVPHVELPVRHERATPQPLREVIQNLDDVERAIVDTQFAWMLDEEPRQ